MLFRFATTPMQRGSREYSREDFERMKKGKRRPGGTDLPGNYTIPIKTK